MNISTLSSNAKYYMAFAIFLLCTVMVFPLHAMAGAGGDSVVEPPQPRPYYGDPKDYRPNRKLPPPSSEEGQYYGQGLLSQQATEFEYAYMHGAPKNLVHLKFTTPTPVSGCAQLDNYKVVQTQNGRTITLTVDFPRLRLRKNVRNPQYNCNSTKNVASTIAAIDKNKVIDGTYNKLKLVFGEFALSFDMHATQDMFSLDTPNNVLQAPMEYWTLPENTIVLSVPSATHNILNAEPQMLADIARVAYANNLRPIEQLIPNYVPNNALYNRFFFVDTTGAIAKKLAPGAPIKLGQASTYEIFFGPHGKYNKEKMLDIFAEIPAEND